MSTHAELAARLLKDAASFFHTVAEQNVTIKEQMLQNASIFEKISEMVLREPLSLLDGKTYAVLSSGLLRDAAIFFRTLAEQNPPLQQQMSENAYVYDKIADLVSANPHGTLE